MWNTVKNINSYLSGPNLPPWNETDWHFFESESVKNAFKELNKALEPSGTITIIRFIGPYKIGKTSALNYYFRKYVQGSGVKFIFHELKQDGRDSHTKMIVQWFTQYADGKSNASTDEVSRKLWEHLKELTQCMYVLRPGRDNVLDKWQAYWNEKDNQFATVLAALRRQGALDAYWIALTIRIKDRIHSSSGNWGNFFRYLQNALNNDNLSFRSQSLVHCWKELEKCDPEGLRDVLVFWEEFEGAVPEVDAMLLNPTIFSNSKMQIRYICVGRKTYQGVQADVPNERSGSPGFEGKASSGDLVRQSIQKTIELHAFTCDEALKFVIGEGVREPFRHIPLPCQNSIPDQVGYHPALLQIMCWGILSEFYTPRDCSACWDDCLDNINDIGATLSALLTDSEREAILTANRGINQQMMQQLKEKGVVLWLNFPNS